MTAKKMDPAATAIANRVRGIADPKASVPDHTPAKSKRKGVPVVFKGSEGPCVLHLSGRELWALRELIRAGARGVTPIERPAPRWSHYVFMLRSYGLDIETIREPHSGDYPGHHGRYVLRSTVAIGGLAE